MARGTSYIHVFHAFLTWENMTLNETKNTFKDSTCTQVSAVSSMTSCILPLIVPCTEFFQQHKEALRVRLSLLGPILDRLEDGKVLINEERQNIESKPTEIDQHRTLLYMLWKKGPTAQQKFHEILIEVNPCLVESLTNHKVDLENIYTKRT